MQKEEYQRIYDLEETHWWYLGMRKISKNLLLSVFPGAGNIKILDAGCGTGGMMIFLKQFGQISGIDLSDEALKFCQERGLKDVSKSSIEKTPFPDKSFDLVTSFDVLYHQWVNNDKAAFNEFFRILKPGGHLLVRVPAYNWLRGKHDNVVATKHRYTKSELAIKAKSSGFLIKRSSYANTFLFPLVILRRLMDKFHFGDKSSDVQSAPPFINNLLKHILFFEAFLIRKINLPFGLSVFLLAEKPGKA
ncbi:MAG: methyltransferase domain-containing protein [bacterium]|nr:methyltransferase domain-containing protein [bacterium]